MTIKKISPVSETYAGYSGTYDKIIKEQANLKEEDYSAGEKVKKILDEKGKPVQPIYNAKGKLIKRPYSDTDYDSSVDIKV